MYAIVDIAGQQLKVEKNQKVFVHRLDEEEGSKVSFDQVLLVDNDGKIEIGSPVVKDMVVSATVVTHLKGDKVKVFKKKRRKGYQVLNGHRQYLTEILIDDIKAGKVAPKKEVAKETAKAEEKTEEAPVAEKKAPAAKKTAATAKTTTKTAASTKKAEPKAKSAAKPKKEDKAE
ncbi:MAG: 50S ribosomal protein L21 [Bacteroidales bacterium]|nr:50S ribosomal protein L21 [Bacteroidales bacterium]MBN2818886.1 50S ribosomal protein L21 [Bacteroidales bacterium]